MLNCKASSRLSGNNVEIQYQRFLGIKLKYIKWLLTKEYVARRAYAKEPPAPHDIIIVYSRHVEVVALLVKDQDKSESSDDEFSSEGFL